MSQFLESIKIEDLKPRNLTWHQQRVEDTFKKFFPDKNPFSLKEAISAHKFTEFSLIKCRIIYTDSIQKIEFIPYQRKQISNFKLVEINDYQYNFKFADRSFFTDLQNRHPKSDDLILVRNNLITDSSYANLVFQNSSGYFTPSTPLLPGTTRARLLHEGKIKLKDISTNHLKDYQAFYLINALLDDKFESGYDISIIK